FRDGLIDAQSTEADAGALTTIRCLADAPIANHCSFWTRIGYIQHAPAAPAAEQTGKQSPAAAAGLGLGARMSMGVCGYHRLIAFVFLPGNVTRVVVADQHHPF